MMTEFIPFQYDGLAQGIILTLGVATAAIFGLRRRRPADRGRALAWTAGLTIIALLGYQGQILFRQAADKGTSETCYSNLHAMGFAMDNYVRATGHYPDAPPLATGDQPLYRQRACGLRVSVPWLIIDLLLRLQSRNVGHLARPNRPPHRHRCPIGITG